MSQQLEQRLRSLEATLLINPRDPWTHSRRGHILIQLGRLDDAAAAFSKVANLDPKMPEGPQGLAEVQLTRGNWTEALAGFEQALDIDRLHIPTLSSLIRAYEARSELHKAETYYTLVLQAKPEDPAWLRRAALNLYSQAKLAQAIPLLERAYAKLADDDEVAASLATCLADAQRFEESRQLFEPISARNALANRDETTFANVLLQLRDWHAAQRVWIRLKSMNPTSAVVRFGLGHCHVELEHHREAIEEIGPFLLEATTADPYWLLARAQLGVSSAADALRCVQQGLERFATDARLHLMAGKSQLLLGRLAEAVSNLDRAVRYEPESLEAWLLLADAHTRLERFDSATRAYEQVVAIAPRDPNLHMRRAQFERNYGTLLRAKECYIRAFRVDVASGKAALGAAECAAELGDLRETREWVDQALRLDSTLIGATRLSGLTHLQAGQPKDALGQLREVAAQLPKDAEVLRAIAQCHALLGEKVREAEVLEKAFALDSDVATAKRLGCVSNELRRFERAVDVLDFVVRNLPNDADAPRDLGAALEQLGQLPASQQMFAKACDNNRSDPLSFFGLGRVLLALKDAASAIPPLEHAVRLDATLPGVEMALGRAYYEAGLLREAAQVYRRLALRTPNDTDVQFELGRTLAGCREHADSAHFLERVVDQEPNHGHAWMLLGSAHAAQDNSRRAMECYQRAAVILTDAVDAFQGLAHSAAALGVHEEAARAARQWLRLRPNDVRGLALLADSLEAMGQFSDALLLWEQALNESPDEKNFILRIGLAHARLDRYAEAARFLSSALTRGGFDIQHWDTLADCYDRLGARDDLAATLEKACELDSTTGARWRRLGFVELALGHEPKALVALSRAWTEGVTDDDCRNQLAGLHRQKAERDLLAEHFEEALAGFGRAIEYLPHDVELRISQGELLKRLGRIEAAILAFEHAVTIDAARLDCQLRLAELLEFDHQSERATAAYARAKQLDPNSDLALSGLARMLWSSGKPRDALEALRRVVELRPDEPQPNLQFGTLLLLEKRPREALPHLLLSAQALPLDASAQHTLAECHAELRQDELAASAFEQALALEPSRLDWMRQFVDSLARLGRVAEIASVLGAKRGEPGWSTGDAAGYGLACFELRRDDDAVSALREALTGESRDDLWLALLECLWRTSRMQEVVECANQILDGNPSQPRALLLAAKATLASSHDETRATELYERLLVADPKSVEAQSEIVRLRSRRAVATTDLTPEESIIELKRALELSPNNPEVLYHLAVAYNRTRQIQAALDVIKQCLVANEHYADAWVLRGELEANAGRHGDARNSFSRALEVSPDQIGALAGIARAEESLDELSLAVSHYRQLCRLEPTVVEWQERVVELSKELADKATTVSHLVTLATLRNLSESERRDLGFMQAELGEHDSAVSNLTQVLALAPSDKNCLFCLSNSLLELARHSDAIPWLERLVRLDSEYPRALELLGICQSRSGRHEQACTNLERARLLGSDNERSLQCLCQSYAALEQKEKQLESLATMTVIAPNEPAHFVALGQIAVDLERTADAIQAWMRALELGADAALREELFDLLMSQAAQMIAQTDRSAARESLILACKYADTEATRLLACARRFRQIDELDLATGAAQRSKQVVDSLECNLLLGELWLQRQRPLEAANCFEHASALRVDSVAALTGLARSQIATEAFIDAEASLQRAQHLAPNDPVVDSLLVQLFRQTNQLQRALACQRRVVSARPESMPELILFGELQLLVGDRAGALESLRAAEKLAPADMSVLTRLADVCAQLERWGELLEVAERAQHWEPESSTWHIWRGRALGHLGRVGDAIREVELATQRHPSDTEGKDLLAELYARSGRESVVAVNPKVAADALQKAIAYGDNRVITRRQLAETLRQLGELHAALEWAQACVKQEPTSEHWLLLGEIEAGLGRHEMAATAFESTVSTDPRCVAGWEGLGLANEHLGRVDVAVDALQSAVRLVPTAAALEGLSRLHAARKDWPKVIDSLQQLGRLRAATGRERRHLADAYRMLGRLDEAAEAYEEAVELNPDDLESLSALARVRLDARRPEDAISPLEKVIRIDPDRTDADELLALAYSRTGRHDQAIATARRQLSRGKSESLLRIVAASHEALGQHLEASSAHAELAALCGDSVESLLMLGQAQIKSGDNEAAIATLLRVHKLSGGQLARNELRPLLLGSARRDTAEGRAERALAQIEQALAVSSDDAATQFELAKLLVDLKFSDRALLVLGMAAPRMSEATEPSNMAAAICVELGRWQDALDWYERANRVRLDDFTSLVGLGRCRAALGRHGDARAPLLAALEQRSDDEFTAKLLLEVVERETSPIARRQCLEELVRLRPADRLPRLRLAELEAAAQRHARVSELLDGPKLTEAGDIDALLLLARALLAQGKVSECQNTCGTILRLQPDHPAATRILGQSQAQSGDTRAAIAAMEASLTAAPSPELARQLYELHRSEATRQEAQNDVESAIRSYSRSVELVADDVASRIALARLLVQTKRTGDAIELLRVGLKPSSEHIEGFLMLGQLYLDCGRTDLSVEAFRVARSLSPTSTTVAAQLGIALSRHGSHDEALELLVRLTREAEVSPLVREEIVSLQQRRGDVAGVAAQLEQLRREKSLTVEQQRELALYWASSDRKPEAFELLSHLFRRDTSDFDVALAFGRVAQSLGKMDEALEGFRAAARLQPQRGDVAEWYGAVLLATDRPREALSALELALALGRTEPGVHEMIAASALRSGDRSRWVQALRARTLLQPNAAAIQIDLAEALVSTGSYGEARVAFERAVALERNPRWYKDLAKCCETLGDHPGWLEALSNVCDTSPHDARAHAEYGLARFALGHLHAAVEALQKALQLDPTIEQAKPAFASAARNLAKELVQQRDAPKALDLYAGIVRYQSPTADLLFEYASCHSSLGQREPAISLLQRALELEPGNEAATLLLAGLLATQGRGAEAIQACESALARHPNSTAIARSLSVHYAEQGRFDLAARSLAQAYVTGACDLDYVLAYVLALVSNGQTLDAIQVGRAELDRFPNSPDLLQRVGALYAGQGWYPQSEELLRRAVGIEPHHPSRHYLYVRTLLELGHDSTAMQWLEDGLQRFPRDPSLVSLLVTFGVRSDAAQDFRRSAQLYQRVLDSEPSNLVACQGLASALVMLGLHARALSVLERGVEVNPSDPQLRFSLGSLYAMQRRLADATRHWEVLRTLHPELALRLAQILGS